MAVRFIEGWDFHTIHSGSANGFEQDYNNYWTVAVGSNGWITYGDGYGDSQAALITTDVGTNALIGGSGANNTNNIPQTGVLRIYFWAKLNTPLTGSTYRPLVAITRGNFSTQSIAIEINGSGSARISQVGFLGAGTGPSATVLSGAPVSSALTNDWACYEFYVNEGTNTTEVRKNGVVILQSSTSFSVNGTGSRQIVFGRPDGTQYPSIDHIIITDGERLATGASALHGVAVGCAFNRGTGSSAQLFKGALRMGGSLYNTGTDGQNLGDPNNDPDENYLPARYYVFPNRPDTGGAWTSKTALNSIDAWGLCSENTTENAALKLSSICLYKIVNDPASGHPVLEVQKAGSAIVVSGTWEKTNEGLTFGGHLQDIPHADLISEDEWLWNKLPGCLLFNIPAGKILQSVGLTFAEEYRTDFTDWVSVDGSGTDFESYFISGYNVLGEGNKKFQSNYVTVNYQDSDVASQAYFQGIWDYALGGNTGRWSSRQAIYTGSEGNYKHFFRRLKVRGHGKALQFRVTSEAGKDFIINGWTVAASGNTSV